MHRIKGRAVVVGGVALCGVIGNVNLVRAADTNATWTGASFTQFDWSDGTKWSSNPKIPNNTASETFAATVGQGFVRLDQDVAVNQLSLSGTNTQLYSTTPATTLTVDGTTTLSGGYLGVTRLVSNGQLLLSGGVRLGSGLSFGAPGMRVDNAGTATWSSTAAIRTVGVGNLPTFYNLAGANFLAQSDTEWTSVHFHNEGTLRKTAGAGGGEFWQGSILGGSFHNTGTVQVEQGTLNLTGKLSGGGTYSVSPGGLLSFGGLTFGRPAEGTLDSTTSISGGGNLIFHVDELDVGGTYSIAGRTEFRSGMTTFTAGANVQNLGTSVNAQSRVEFQTGAAISLPTTTIGEIGWIGGDDDVTVNGKLTWNGGSIAGSGTTTVTGGIDLTGGRIRTGRTIDSLGTVDWTAGTVSVEPNTVFNNKAGAIFNVSGNRSFEPAEFSQVGPSTFNNHGTFRVNAPIGAANMYPTFNNHGTVDVQTGSIAFARQLNNLGTVNVAAGATVHMVFGTHTLAAGSTLAGAGSARFYGATGNVAGAYDIATRTDVDGGSTVNFNAGAEIRDIGETLFVGYGSVVNFNTAASAPVGLNDVWVEGKVAGTDTLDIAGRIYGSGHIEANVLADGTLAPGNSAGRLTVQGELTLAHTSKTEIEIGGLGAGTQYDVIGVTGQTALDGELLLKFLGDFGTSVTGADIFTLLSATGGLNGGFANVGNGQRLMTENGIGSFLVHFGDGSAFGQNSVTLSDFRAGAIPEPGALALAMAGAPLLLRRHRSRMSDAHVRR